MDSKYREEALRYHQFDRPGKIEVCTTKPCVTQRDLSLAYTPGVAEPCRDIEKNPDDIFKYTSKGNLVAVISNGTAVLGLGNIGPGAGKPVMEGKGVLFKRFADIDVFDIELDSNDPDAIIKTVKMLEPTFGGINLEDIKAPECFYIEEQLKKQMNIPVFHDDQHGTAIISGAGLLNAVEIAKKKMKNIKIVMNGAGASSIACAKFYVSLGARRENIIMFDTKGVIYKGRKEGMNPYKEDFATDPANSDLTLESALKGADVFVGLSGANILSQKMVKGMADTPIIFAMANPDPEITYEDARAAREDAIVATGRSDYPNQVNNVLGFPFIFRGALDVRARKINEEMKVAAARALADLTKEPVPYSVMKAYRVEELTFGPDYIIPKPFDSRVLIWESAAVAKAAMDSGVAGKTIDIDKYREELEAHLGGARQVMRVMINKAKKEPKRIVFPEGEHDSILKACEIILDEGMAHPILLGSSNIIEKKLSKLHVENIRNGVEIIDPNKSEHLKEYANKLFDLRKRKGLIPLEAHKLMQKPNYFGSMMVHLGHADGLVSGITKHYPETIRPALQIIGVKPEVHKVAGVYMMIIKNSVYFFGDATVNIDPSAEDLAEIALLCANAAKRFNIIPKVALLSFSNFGSTKDPTTDKIRHALQIIKKKDPKLIVDGEMQGDTAVTPEILDNFYPFSDLAGKGGANVLIFSNLEAGNTAVKLVQRLSGAEAIGPILLGMQKPVHVLQIGAFNEVDVVYMTAVAVVEAQEAK